MDLGNSAINKIGNIIREGPKNEGYTSAVETLNIWREWHGDILDNYYRKCSRLALSHNREIIVARRLKRLPTIIDKLDRYPEMRLSSMQDIAGVRIIVKDMDELKKLYRKIIRWRNLYRVRDYLESPKSTGYRGIHFVFKKDNQCVEVQLRTELQHLWATSVESLDFITGSSMKTRASDGYWNEFFVLVSSAFAKAEGTQLLPGFSQKKYSDILGELKVNISSHGILGKLDSMALTNVISDDIRFKKSHFVLLDLDYSMKKCSVLCFKERYYEDAVKEYEKLEAEKNRKHNVVLVSVGGFKKLKDAYPNYFVDLRKFRDIIAYMLEINGNKDII